jgi:TPR repeat protein
LVLQKLGAKGGIAPDIALALNWYQKARTLGSAQAPERLKRLALIPE